MYNEKELQENIKENGKYLKEFKKSMAKSKLSDKTIKKHFNNVDFYINDYLNYYEPTKMKDGCYELGGYLGDFFIRKCMWSTGYATKENASSIKKFYKCMYELGYINKEDYEYLCDDIKENVDYWIREVEDYNNFDEDDIFDFI